MKAPPKVRRPCNKTSSHQYQEEIFIIRIDNWEWKKKQASSCKYSAKESPHKTRELAQSMSSYRLLGVVWWSLAFTVAKINHRHMNDCIEKNMQSQCGCTQQLVNNWGKTTLVFYQLFLCNNIGSAYYFLCNHSLQRLMQEITIQHLVVGTRTLIVLAP